ncbi:RIP metalloprotease RseP [Flavobacterium agricola]|uniref:Zinc metalloprotease n=1 Tax=Flavobacterium agricola TaxID=2870839 RepID=A0ABY6LXU1_9FLAO|nr:RIP metalloprotease RseP [Flavobacterium agricola]UYW01147.1 RIP metalloprotease RseP [Flavobacterium agricola]
MIQVAQILFILSILVILHEFGHYLTAKMFKVKVEKFYLFMDAGFSVVKKKIGETEWGIGWLPLGGYVKLAGMIDESMDTEQLKQEPQPWEFRAKPAWQRLIIMLGGIIVNVLLAWGIFTVLYTTYGQKYISTEVVQKNGLMFGDAGLNAGFKNGDKIVSVDGKLQDRFNRMTLDVLLGNEIIVERDGKLETIILTDEHKKDILGLEGKQFMMPRLMDVQIDSVIPDASLNKAGILPNDKIVSLNNQPIVYFDELKTALDQNKGENITLGIVRDNQPINVDVVVGKDATLGFIPKFADLSDSQVVNKLSFGQALKAGIDESYQLIVYNIKQFKLILSPKTEAYKQVKSPIGIARMLPDTWNWEFIWSFTALFSIGLAFMNILPIPGLDGGHALFTIAEMITGKKLSEKTMGYVQTVGMIILLTLMVLTFGKDIYELIADKLIK